MDEKKEASSIGRNTSILLATIAALTLFAGLFAWVYTEFRPATFFEREEEARKEWLDRWLNERKWSLDSIVKRIERLEDMHLKEGKHK